MQSNRIKSDITKKSLFFNTYMHCFRRFTYSYLFIIVFFKENNSKTVWKLEERNSSFGQFCNDLEKVCEKVFLRFPLYPSRCTFALCSCNLVEINCKGPQTNKPQKVGSREDLISENIQSRHIEFCKADRRIQYTTSFPGFSPHRIQ